MPYRPQRPCSKQGCPNLTNNPRGYCDQHLPDKYRQETAARTKQVGYSYRWNKYTKLYLKEHPLCMECLKEGRVTPATEVDHIIPYRGNMELFWNPDNHQPLCKSHHSQKTAKEDGAFRKSRS